MQEEKSCLYTCQYNSKRIQQSLQNTIQQPEDSKQQQQQPENSKQQQEKIPTNNPKIKFIPIQNQQCLVNQINQPQQQINQTNNSNRYDQDLSITTTHSQSIFQTNSIIDQTIFQTKAILCFNCTQNIKQNSILLSCFHSYHKECLDELIKEYIDKNQPIIFCRCNMKIHQKFILNLIQDRQLKKKYFINQLCGMIQKAPLQFQQSLLVENKSHPQNLKNILDQLMVEDDTPQKIHQK
ncbi:unnamed protein product [Paramecium pentaurelia]|uniref:RING-type domain-containing protein n=1 Tax=Paramecium pentaurelia TaxID=43138 RepID=A0A8S1XUI7_9CILI|nr:unnamed protein product [Paramecium pentaurelia]